MEKKGKEVSQLIVPSQFIGDHLKSFNSSAKNVMEQHHQMECPNNPEMEWRALVHIRNTATPTHTKQEGFRRTLRPIACYSPQSTVSRSNLTK